MLRIPIKIIAFVIVNKHQFNLFQVADSFDDRSIEARFAKVVQSASEASNGGVPGGHHGRTSRPRPQLSTTSADPGTSYPGVPGTPRYRLGAAVDPYNDSPSRQPATDSSGTVATAGTGASSGASRTKRPRPKIHTSEI